MREILPRASRVVWYTIGHKYPPDSGAAENDVQEENMSSGY